LPPSPDIRSGRSLEAARRFVRAVPDSLPGKTRLVRRVLRLFPADEPVRVPDRFGNTLSAPSLREPIAAALFGSGVYERDTLAAILSRLPPGGVYLDVGANIGALALAVAAERPDARIVCIEADPAVAAVLEANVAANERTNVVTITCIAGGEEAEIPFYRAPDHKFGMGSLGPQFGDEPVRLRQRALDDVLDELGIGAVDVVKLDIEGGEFGALKGLQRRLASAGPPAVVFEFADWAEARIAGQKPGDAQELLLSRGYRLFRLGRGGAPGEALPRPLGAGSAMFIALPPMAN